MKKAAKSKRSIQNPAVPLTSARIVEYLGGGATSPSGMLVNARTILKCSPVWQGLDIISSDVGKLPFITYRALPTGGRDRAVGHPVYRLLHRHTGEMTSNLWVSRMVAHALLYGNAYSRVYWKGSTIDRIEWLHRDWVEVDFDRDSRTYLIRYPRRSNPNNEVVRVPDENIIHLIGLTVDEFGGLSLIDYARDCVGRQLSAGRYADDFFHNDATPRGFFVHPGEMSVEAQERFLEGFASRHGGPGNRFRAGILEEGMTWTQSGISPEDAMLVDQLKLGVLDVARFFNLPPHKLGDSARVSYNSLEQENKAYADSTLGKWISRLEYECTYKLLLDREIEEGYVCEFLQDSRLKADTEARYKAYQIALGWGIMSPNEVRGLENMNPYEGGDDYFRPTTHQSMSDSDEVSPESDTPTGSESDTLPDSESDSVPSREVSEESYIVRDLVLSHADSAARLLVNVCAKAAKTPDKFLARINDIRSKAPGVISKISPVSAILDKEAEKLADMLINRISDDMLVASECRPDELVSSVELSGERFRVWVGSTISRMFIDRMEGRKNGK